MTQRLDNDLLDAIVTNAFDVIGIVAKVAAGHDLSLTQFRLLAILRDRSPRLSEVADYLGLDRSSVSGLVDRAVARGLIERTADPDDRRASRLDLTDAGRELARVGEEEVRAGVAPLFSRLGAQERTQLMRLLAGPA